MACGASALFRNVKMLQPLKLQGVADVADNALIMCFKARVEPDCVADDLGRELMTGRGDWLHAPIYRGRHPTVSIPVTSPKRGIIHV
jgi:hypothetical protein